MKRAPDRSGPETIRTAIVDDHPLVREKLPSLFALIPDLTIVDTAGDGPKPPDLFEEQSPDVEWMNVRMPGMNGMAVTHEICARHPPTASSRSPPSTKTSTSSNRCGWERQVTCSRTPIPTIWSPPFAPCTPGSPSSIRSSQRGSFDAPIARMAHPALTERLTPREREVLQLVAQGATNAKIAEALCLAEGTVKNHVSHILGKLDARGRAEAARLATEWGLLDE